MGLTPLQAIIISTKNAAETLSVNAGTIESGKIADLIIINENPLENINVLCNKKNISKVIKNGKVVVM